MARAAVSLAPCCRQAYWRSTANWGFHLGSNKLRECSICVGWKTRTHQLDKFFLLPPSPRWLRNKHWTQVAEGGKVSIFRVFFLMARGLDLLEEKKALFNSS